MLPPSCLGVLAPANVFAASTANPLFLKAPVLAECSDKEGEEMTVMREEEAEKGDDSVGDASVSALALSSVAFLASIME